MPRKRADTSANAERTVRTADAGGIPLWRAVNLSLEAGWESRLSAEEILRRGVDGVRDFPGAASLACPGRTVGGVDGTHDFAVLPQTSGSQAAGTATEKCAQSTVSQRACGSDFSARMAGECPLIQGYVVDGARYGGGQTFGWEKNETAWRALAGTLRQIAGGRRLILAGGLTADNVAQGIRIFEPDVVDVSSGVETDGVKDREKINQFIREVRGK